MPALPKNWAALDVMEDDVKLVRLIRKTAVVEEYIRTLLAANFASDSNGLAGWAGGAKNGWSVAIELRGIRLSNRSEDVQKNYFGTNISNYVIISASANVIITLQIYRTENAGLKLAPNEMTDKDIKAQR